MAYDPTGTIGLAGVAGGADAIKELIARRLAQAQFEQTQKAQADTVTQNQAHNQYLQDALAQQERIRGDANREAQRAHDLTSQDKANAQAANVANTVPENTFMGMTDPGVSQMQKGGYGSLALHKDALAALPGDWQGPLQGGDTRDARPEGYVKLASFKQLQDDQTQSLKLSDLGRKSDQTEAGIAAKVQELTNAATRLEMQGKMNEANIARANADALLKAAQANAANAKADNTGTAKPLVLSQRGKDARASIEQAGPLTDQVLEMIRKEAPDIETNPDKYNTLGAKGTSFLQTLKYKAGFNDPTDPRQQLVSLLQPIQGGNYMRNSRSRQMLELVLKHMADPSQTLSTQYERAKQLKGLMPEMLEGIVRGETPVDPANPLSGSYFDPAKGGAAGAGGGLPPGVTVTKR